MQTHTAPIRKIQENPITFQREILKNFNGKASKVLDGLPICFGQVQHKQIRHQWPKSVATNNHLYYERDQEQNTQQKLVGYMKAKFTGIVDLTNSEFQGQYLPIDTDQQIHSASSQQVKDIIEQSITAIHAMLNPQAQELNRSQ